VNGTFISFCLTFSLIPYLLPLPMPTWRWLAGTTIAVGGLLSALLIQDWIARSDPGYRGGPGDVFGILIACLITAGFASGAGTRAVTLFLQSRGVRTVYCVAVSIAGLPITIAVIVLLGARRVW
jgi:hypothetical protein